MDREEIDLQTPVGAVVKAWRTSRGWNLTELANRANLTKGYISEVERGKIFQPGVHHLQRLAGALNIPAHYLVTRRFPTARGASTRRGDRRAAAVGSEPGPGAVTGAARPENGGRQPRASTASGVWGSGLRMTPSGEQSDRDFGRQLETIFLRSGLPSERIALIKRLVIAIVSAMCEQFGGRTSGR